MLLVMWHSVTNQTYLAYQTQDFKFNRLDRDGGDHMWGKKYIPLSRYQVGPKEWTQIGPLNLVEWSE